jgi:uncharacterized protein (DUF305 family)
VSSPHAGIVALLAAALLVSCSGTRHQTAPSTHSDQPVVTGEPAGDNAADVSFAEAVLAQDQQAVELATLVPDRSTSPNVVAAATNSTATRRSEISILKVLLVQWSVNQDSSSANTARGMIDPATLAKLRSLRGGAFESLWIHSMLGLSQAGLDMATTEITGGKNEDAVGFARQVGDARRTEIALLNKTLRS